jgi:hypothetical protein
MGQYLLWTAPQVNLEDEWERAEYEGSYALRRFGAILAPAFVWEKWQSIGHFEARLNCFPPATRRELRDAWLMELKGASQVRRDAELLPMLKRRLLGCDSLSVEAALSKVTSMLTWLNTALKAPLQGAIVPFDISNLDVETLYFDGQANEDWSCISLVEDVTSFAFGKNWVYMPSNYEKSGLTAG